MYATSPRYTDNQPPFINCVLRARCNLTPHELLYEVLSIEDELGRNREKAGWKGPRTIDIDLLLYDSQRLETADLTIPHHGICDRKFVLIPLLELDPLLREPTKGEPYHRYLSALAPQGIYYYSLKQYHLRR